MTMALNQSSVSRLAKLLGMLGSAHEGERAVAAAKADTLVRQLGLTWHDVIAPATRTWTAPAPSSDWQRMALFCQARISELTLREQEFVNSSRYWRREPTARQLDWLISIYARLHRGAGR